MPGMQCHLLRKSNVKRRRNIFGLSNQIHRSLGPRVHMSDQGRNQRQLGLGLIQWSWQCTPACKKMKKDKVEEKDQICKKTNIWELKRPASQLPESVLCPGRSEGKRWPWGSWGGRWWRRRGRWRWWTARGNCTRFHSSASVHLVIQLDWWENAW